MATKVEINKDVKFTDKSTGKDVGVTYDWNFGDGVSNNGTTDNPVYHRYSTFGTFNVTHTVKNTCNTVGVTCTTQQVEVLAELPSSGIGSTVMMIGAAILGFMMMTKKK